MFSPSGQSPWLQSLFLLCLCLVPGGGAADFIGIESRRIESAEGKATLKWQSAEAGATDTKRFELAYSQTADFEDSKTRYEGSDSSTTITGLTEGEHFYRVREVLPTDHPVGAWSEPLVVVVKYPAKRTVVILMSLGLFSLVSTVAAVLRGHAATLPKEDS